MYCNYFDNLNISIENKELAIEKITKVVKNFDLRIVLKIMQVMEWTYDHTKAIVTLKDIQECIVENIIKALESMDYSGKMNHSIQSGGFECRVFNNDEGNLWRIEVEFIPIKFNIYHDLKKKNYDQNEFEPSVDMLFKKFDVI